MSFIARCYRPTHITWTKSVTRTQIVTLIFVIFRIGVVRGYGEGMLNLYSVCSASNVRRLCALWCPAISFLHFQVLQFHVLHFHVLQFHVLSFGPSFSRPAISCPANWSVNFTSVIFTSSIFSAPLFRPSGVMAEAVILVRPTGAIVKFTAACMLYAISLPWSYGVRKRCEFWLLKRWQIALSWSWVINSDFPTEPTHDAGGHKRHPRDLIVLRLLYELLISDMPSNTAIILFSQTPLCHSSAYWVVLNTEGAILELLVD